MKNKSRIINALERNDQYDELQTNQRTREEIEVIMKENKKLEFILNKYNFILNEYQLKYGNELFNELDKQLNMEALDSIHNNMSEFKKILVENVSIIREYEKVILEKSKNIEFLNGEINRFQIEMEKLIEENKLLGGDLEKTKEEQEKLYKTILNNKPIDMNYEDRRSQSGGFSSGFHNFSKTMNMNVDVQANIENLKSQNEQLLQLIERTKYESEHHRSLATDFKEKYDSLLISYETLNNDYKIILTQNEQLMKTKNFVEEKIKENNYKLMINETKTNEAVRNFNKIEIEYKYIKQELEHFKEMFNEFESRKNNELEAVMRELNDIKISYSEMKSKTSILEENNSDFKFENSKLKHENQILKYDCDHLTKILEESNFAINSASEKEKHIDYTIKSYKKKIEEANLEKEKCIVKQRLLEKQILKMGEDYTKLLTEKQSQYENFIDSSKDKFEQIISNKDEEISNLKNDNLALKFEKDKYQNEFSTMKKEFDKFSSIFREENDKYIKKYEETEKSANRMQNHLHDKINVFVKKVEKLEHEKNLLENELNMFKSTERNRELLLDRINKSDENYSKENNKLKEKCESLLKEKEYLEKEIERITNVHETKMQQMKEQNDLRVTVLENTMKYQKDEFSATEDKAYDLLKKQENITNKFKEEYRNTVFYYENLIENLLKENRSIKKQAAIDNDYLINNNEEYPEKI